VNAVSSADTELQAELRRAWRARPDRPGVDVLAAHDLRRGPRSRPTDGYATALEVLDRIGDGGLDADRQLHGPEDLGLLRSAALAGLQRDRDAA
jgi:hypothetical protein